MALNILAIESYYGGSHKAFLDGWTSHSRHHWDLLTLPAERWKSRVRHSAYHFASEILNYSKPIDVLFCTDLINLADLIALTANRLTTTPIVLYFHENQFTYPVQPPNKIDQNLAFQNLTSAIAATEIWWNSQFNQTQFQRAASEFTNRLSDYDFSIYLESCQSKSKIFYPAVDLSPPKVRRHSVPTITWAARWEHDKAPQVFFQAMDILRRKGVEFKLNVMGEQGSYTLECFSTAKESLKNHIQRWGYQPSREEYLNGLAESDLFVSTARHEFFGISVCEAVLCGAYPVLPLRLAYPEVMQLDQYPERREHFYQGGANELAQHLIARIHQLKDGQLWQYPQSQLQNSFTQYQMDHCARQMDTRLEQIATG